VLSILNPSKDPCFDGRDIDTTMLKPLQGHFPISRCTGCYTIRNERDRDFGLQQSFRSLRNADMRFNTHQYNSTRLFRNIVKLASIKSVETRLRRGIGRE
jgi:hypothetical protein